MRIESFKLRALFKA